MRTIALCVIVACAFAAGVFAGYALFVIEPSGARAFHDPQVVAWAGVAATFAVVFVALFVNVIKERIERPRFEVTHGEAPPLQVKTRLDDGDGSELLHVRLRIQNTGLASAERCEVRLEHVYELRNGGWTAEPIGDHDPRPLKWVGRDTSPIDLSPGAFDLVDLGAQNSQSRDHLRLEFGPRGHLDVNLVGSEVVGFRIGGTVYANKASPRSFCFDLEWDPCGEVQSVQITEA